jgi:hypothetical protein
MKEIMMIDNQARTEKVKKIDVVNAEVGIRAFVWDVMKMV